LTLSADDPSGVSEMCVSNSASCTSWEAFSTSKSWELTSGDGEKTVYAWLKDAAGNTNVNPYSDSIILDTTAPTGSVMINGGATYTNTTAVNLTLSSNDTGSGVSQMCISNTTSCSSWEAYATSKSWTLPSGDGDKTVYVWFKDTVGNANSIPYSDTIILDTTNPVSTITTPVNGAAVIATTTYTIKGTASDTGSQVQKVEISIDGGATWNLATGIASWSYQWTLPVGGTYTIKSRATDNAGNVEISSAGVTITAAIRQPTSVAIDGKKLVVDGNPFTIKGVGYSPVPIGEDPEIGLPHGDYFTSNYSSIFNRDLPLLRQLGANTIRLWGWNNTANHLDFLDKAYNNGINPIYVIAGYWINGGLNIDPSSPNNVREQLKNDFRAMVEAHKNHPAILMWCIGNELNADWMYGGSLGHLFSLINEMAAEAHSEEGVNYHPVTTALIDVNLINTISSYDATAPSLDVWGANIYRGNTFGSLFNDYETVSNKPLVILEYGIDAFDNVHGNEYELIGTPYQAEYAAALWNEIVVNSDFCVGGSIMAYSDEWWKGKYSTGSGCPDNNPAYHSTCGYAASSHPDGYANEEWWGIMRTVDHGSAPDIMEPRVIYYRLKALWVGLTGDCNRDGQTTIDEVQMAINQFLGVLAVQPCCDLNGNGQVTIDEVQRVINAFLGII
jgi:hypothetical protein